MKRARPLRLLYLAKGFSGRSFAKEIGCTHESMLDWEQGRSYPNFWYFHRMVEILGDLSAVYLALSEGIKPPKKRGPRK